MNYRNLVDLRIDFAFKQLFGRTGNERILIDFLNEILKLPDSKKIQNVTVRNSELLKEYDFDKKAILDLLVQTNEGTYINIEIQFGNKYNMPVRTLFYSARILAAQIEQSMAYTQLKQTITINIVNFIQFKATDAYHTRFELYDPLAKITLTDRLQVHFIELPKLLRLWEDGKVNPYEDRLVRWLLMFEAATYGTILEELEGIAMKLDPVLREAFEKWEELSRDSNTRFAYEAWKKQLLDEHAIEPEREIRHALALEEAVNKGMATGITKGIAKGIAEGKAKGIEEGKAEGKAEGKLEIIRVMLQKGASVSQIAELTGYTIAEIEQIQ